MAARTPKSARSEPVTPNGTDTPGAPEAPDTPGGPATLGGSEVQGTPRTPVTRGDSEAPGTPGGSEAPVTPGDLEAPVTPRTPVTPGGSEVQGTPGAPATLGGSQTPVTPRTPVTPGDSEAPVTPDGPGRTRGAATRKPAGAAKRTTAGTSARARTRRGGADRTSDRRGGADRTLLAAALALAVAAAVAAVLTGWSWYGAAHDDDAAFARTRDTVLAAGEQAVQNLNTLDHDDLDHGLDIWESSTTGDLHSQLTQGRDDFARQVRQAKTTSTAKVLSGAVTELDTRTGKAAVMVALRITVQAPGAKLAVKESRMLGELTRTPDGWKLSALGQAPTGDSAPAATATATATTTGPAPAATTPQPTASR